MSALKRFEEQWRGSSRGQANPSDLFQCHQALKEHLQGCGGADGGQGESRQLYCVLLGDQGAGKTALMTRLTKQVL